ncbi:hypothetical protein GGI12_001586 [Dipsacomyces acuminosporus]|nr:hypothetical protein GGI12_001586 [Dipsacomyces acuminosporus]
MRKLLARLSLQTNSGFGQRPRSFALSKPYCSVTAWGAYVDQFAAAPSALTELGRHFRTTPTKLSIEKLFGQGASPANARIGAIGAGVRHAIIAAHIDGVETETRLLGFGINRCSQLGGESQAPVAAGATLLRQTIEGKVIQIACGREHTAMLVERPNGARNVLVCGSNAFGQLGYEPRQSQIPVLQTSALRNLSSLDGLLGPAETPAKIQCGLDHTAVLTSSGRVFAMGWGADGQLGAGPESTDDHATPVAVAGIDGGPIVDISSTTDFTLALSANNTLYYWGNAEYGQCMTGEKIDRVLSAMKVPFGQKRVASIAAGGSHALVLDSCGRVYVCGYGALGLGPDTTSVLRPTLVKGISDISFIAASTDRCLAVDSRQRVYSWGLGNAAGRLGNGTVFENVFEPQVLAIDPAQVDLNLVGLGNDICVIGSNA